MVMLISPLNSGFFPMFLAMVLMILASQCFALFVTGMTRRSRIALSACALWGVLSFSICGFTYPVRSMPELAQIGSNLFQMRHYFFDIRGSGFEWYSDDFLGRVMRH